MRAVAVAGCMLLVCGSAIAAKPLFDRETADRLKRGLGLLGGASQALRQEQQLSPLERQRRAYGVVEHAPFDQALARILQDIRGAAGAGAPDARIHVTPDPGLHAFAAEDGSIFIAAGMLRSMESEDEVAALVAHEYAHVLHRHSGRTALQQAKDMAEGLSAMYMDYEYGGSAMQRSRPEAEFLRAAVLREAAMQSVQSGIVPTRARSQEDEADRVGTNLLVAAGYSPVGMIEMLGRLDAWEAQRKAASSGQDAMAGPRTDGVDGAVVRYAQKSDQARAARRKIDDDSGLVNTFIGGLVGATRKGVRESGRSHRTSEERIDLVLSRIQGEYGERERPDMRPLPWAKDAQSNALFTSVDLVQRLLGENDSRLSRPGREQAAALQEVQRSPAGRTALGRYVTLRHTATALGSDAGRAAWRNELARDDSLFAAHRLVLDLSNRMQAEAAIDMLETSRRSLADPPELLPYGIRIQRRAGNRDAAEALAARCRGASSEGLRKACAEAG